MNKRYVISLDQGTTSTKAVMFDNSARIIGIKSFPVEQIYSKPGWVEHNALEIWEGLLYVIRSLLDATGVSIDEIACLGITNQRETVVVWDKYTGKPVYNAIVWQCRRTAPMCDRLIKSGLQDIIQEKTGLIIDAYFSGTKIKWILDNVEGVQEGAREGRFIAGTIDSWLVWNLTGGRVHATDYTNASRTMLYNIRKLEWDKELLKELDIPESMLPKVFPSSGLISETSEQLFGAKIPISGAAGDQQAALFGQTCFEMGSAKNTYGTGCFILMNTGKTIVKSKHNLISTIACGIDGAVEYALEGSVFNAGSAIQWLRDEMKLIDSAPESDVEAEKVQDTAGVYVVPAFTGLGAPYWDAYARGTIIGITRGTRREHVIRATLESIAFQSRDVLEAIQADSGIYLQDLKVDGGASVSSFLMQFQADILGVKLSRPKVTEITALGAAYLAGLGVGFWKDRKEIEKRWEIDRTFLPQMEFKEKELKYSNWKKAVNRSRNWEDSL